jgi:hypothetical protein
MNEAAIQAIREVCAFETPIGAKRHAHASAGNCNRVCNVQDNDAIQERHIVDALENLKRDSLTQGGQKVQRNSGSQEEMDQLPMTVKRSICLIEAVRTLSYLFNVSPQPY